MSFANPVNGIIVQSGRDTDLSDLANNTGVTTTTDAGVTFYDIGTNRMQICGTVSHDPETEVLICRHLSTSNSTSTTVLVIDENGSIRSWKNPTDITKNADGTLVWTSANHGLQVGDAIRVRSINSDELYNETCLRIDAVTTDTFTVGRGDYFSQPAANTVTDTHIPYGQFTRIPCYNYGKEIQANGRVRYSVGAGMIFSGGSTSNWDPDEYSIAIGRFGFFWSRGGTVVSNRPLTFEGGYDMVATTWSSPRQSNGTYSPVEIRSMGKGWFLDSRLVNMSGINLTSTRDVTVKLEGGALSEVLGSWWEISLLNFDVNDNANEIDIGHDGSATHHHHDYEILNSANGSNIISMWRPVQRNSSAQRGVVATKKQVAVNIKDGSSNPIENVKMHLKDKPSAYAKKATFRHGTDAGAYTKTPTLLNGTVNDDKTPGVLSISVGGYSLAGGGTNTIASTITSDTDGNPKITISGTAYVNGTNTLTQVINAWNTANSTRQVTLASAGDAGDEVPADGTKFVIPAGEGTITYDYLDPIVYTGTTDANGDISTTKILTSIQIKEYNANDSGAVLNLPNGVTENSYHGEYGYDITFSGGWWRKAGNSLPGYSDWDTDNFGGFYRVDRRSNDNTDADEFTFKFCSYGHLLASSTQPLKGLGELQIDWTMFVDSKLTETNKTLVDQYAEINSAARFYDRAKLHLYTNFAGETDTIVDRDDITIDAGASDIVLISTTAQGDTFAYDKTTDTITIKCDSFTGNLKTTGDVTIGTNITILGTVTDASNPSGASTRSFSILNVIAGATVQIYNESRTTNYQTMIASGTTTNSTLIGDGTSSLSTLATNASLTLDAMADGSFVLPAGWSLTTTTVANDMSRVTVSGLYDEGDGTGATKDFDLGETVRIRITCAAATGAFEPFLGTTLTNASGFSLKANQVADTVYNANGIDGSSTAIEADFEPDYANFQIDTTETDGVVTVQEVYAYYAYLITTTDGIDKFYGAITPIDGMNYQINTSVVNLKIQNTTSIDTILKGGRLYRDDNTSVIDTDSSTGAGTGSFTHDTGFLLQYIAPQVESALDIAASATDMTTVKSDVQSIKSSTGLIPGLL